MNYIENKKSTRSCKRLSNIYCVDNSGNIRLGLYILYGI
jgi:hypothetical protein